MWNFKGYLWNSIQNILPIHWKMWILFTCENLRALRVKSSYAFLKRPPGDGLSPVQRQAITWTNDKSLAIRSPETNIQYADFSLQNINLNLLCVKYHLFCPGLNALMRLKLWNDHHLVSSLASISTQFSRCVESRQRDSVLGGLIGDKSTLV